MRKLHVGPGASPRLARWGEGHKARSCLAAFEGLDWREPVALADIRPTQVAVGMRVVEIKREKIARRAGTARKLRAFLEKRPVPAVLGPDDEHYIIDHHHLSLALWQSDVDEVFVRIVGDLSDMPRRAFFQAMSAVGWLHAYDADGRRICPTRLPRSLDKLQPDRYRDLAWSVREAGGFHNTRVPFSEFAWANFLRERIPASLLTRNPELAHEQAMRVARSQHARHLPGAISRC